MTLTQILQKIKSAFYTKSETESKLNTKANSSDLNNYLPLSGGQMTGDTISRDVDNNSLGLCGGKGYGHGALLQLTGKEEIGEGQFNIQAHNGTVGKILKGKPDGELTWGGKSLDVIEEQGAGYIRYSNGIQICWGTIVTQTQLMPLTFGKAFLSNISYSVAVCPSFNTRCWLTGDRTTTNITLTTESGDGSHRRVDWQAIGKWK